MKQIPFPKLNPYELDRKKTRWENYDYTRSGIYFVTFCTYERVCYFGDLIDEEMKYSNQGSIAEAFINILSVFHKKVKVKVWKYAVMPDHIHALIELENEEADQSRLDHLTDTEEVQKPYKQKNSLSTIIGNYKAAITRCCHRQHLEIKWQNGFNDHIIRNHEEFVTYYNYIERNPANWLVERQQNPMGWVR